MPIGKVLGPGGFRSVLSRGVTAAAERIEWLVLNQVADGDTVMNERIDRFLIVGRWVEIPIASIFRVRDERVCLWRDYFDLETYRKQRA